MHYTDALTKQLHECSDKIDLLKQRIQKNNDPIKENILLLELQNNEMHILSLKKLMFMFDKVISSN